MATLEPLRGTCISLRFSPDSRTLAAGSYLGPEPYMSLWQVPSFEEIATREATLAVWPDGTTLACGEMTGVVKMLDLGTRHESAAHRPYGFGSVISVFPKRKASRIGRGR